VIHNINSLLAYTNKLREIGRPMSERHIINRIIASLPESFARAQSNWTNVSEADRTIARLTNNLKAEETIIKQHSKLKEEAALVAHNGILNHVSSDLTVIQAYSKSKLSMISDKASHDKHGNAPKRGRYDKRGRGRGGFAGRGGFTRPREGFDEPLHTTDSSIPSKPFDCLWCSTNTHKTEDCFSMKNAKQARRNSFKKTG